MPDSQNALQTASFASSLLSEGSYDPQRKTMTLTLTNGRTYDYQGVEPDVWDGLTKAGSAGRYYRDFIMGKYA